jgi:hypothetical protein
MLDMGRQNRIESRLNKEEYNLLLFMKPFHRFFENSEFYDLFGNIVIEQQLKLMLKNLNKLENEKNTRGGKISTLEDLEKYYENDKGGNKSKKQGKNNNINHNLTNTNSSNELHEIKDKDNNANIKEKEENETNLLINRIERYLNYDKVIKDKSAKEIFDKDEFDLIKEMPIARNIFYDIKIKIKNLISKFEVKDNIINKTDNLKKHIKKLIDAYQIEKQTNSDIFNFFCKKFSDIIIYNEEELKKEEENKNKLEEKELGLKEENKDESIKSNKHKGRNKKIKHKNDEENSNKEKEKNKSMDIS